MDLCTIHQISGSMVYPSPSNKSVAFFICSCLQRGQPDGTTPIPWPLHVLHVPSEHMPQMYASRANPPLPFLLFPVVAMVTTNYQVKPHGWRRRRVKVGVNPWPISHKSRTSTWKFGHLMPTNRLLPLSIKQFWKFLGPVCLGWLWLAVLLCRKSSCAEKAAVLSLTVWRYGWLSSCTMRNCLKYP
jgi:hypothetical protein